MVTYLHFWLSQALLVDGPQLLIKFFECNTTTNLPNKSQISRCMIWGIFYFNELQKNKFDSYVLGCSKWELCRWPRVRESSWHVKSCYAADWTHVGRRREEAEAERSNSRAETADELNWSRGVVQLGSLYSELIGSLKLGNVWVFVQLIHKLTKTKNKL